MESFSLYCRERYLELNISDYSAELMYFSFAVVAGTIHVMPILCSFSARSAEPLWFSGK